MEKSGPGGVLKRCRRRRLREVAVASRGLVSSGVVPGGGGPQRGPRGDLLCTLSESGRVPAETWREASHVVLAMFAGPIRPR